VRESDCLTLPLSHFDCHGVDPSSQEKNQEFAIHQGCFTFGKNVFPAAVRFWNIFVIWLFVKSVVERECDNLIFGQPTQDPESDNTE
jgi:hypothetical protein